MVTALGTIRVLSAGRRAENDDDHRPVFAGKVHYLALPVPVRTRGHLESEY